MELKTESELKTLNKKSLLEYIINNHVYKEELVNPEPKIKKFQSITEKFPIKDLYIEKDIFKKCMLKLFKRYSIELIDDDIDVSIIHFYRTKLKNEEMIEKVKIILAKSKLNNYSQKGYGICNSYIDLIEFTCIAINIDIDLFIASVLTDFAYTWFLMDCHISTIPKKYRLYQEYSLVITEMNTVDWINLYNAHHFDIKSIPTINCIGDYLNKKIQNNKDFNC